MTTDKPNIYCIIEKDAKKVIMSLFSLTERGLFIDSLSSDCISKVSL